jgi:hypothetical protein
VKFPDHLYAFLAEELGGDRGRDAGLRHGKLYIESERSATLTA